MKNKTPLLTKLKPVKGGRAIIINSKRHNSTKTFSLIFNKPIAKFEIRELK